MGDIHIPQSEYGGPHPELAARVTSALAAVSDFEREDAAVMRDPASATRPDYLAWAIRLASELKSILEILERS